MSTERPEPVPEPGRPVPDTDEKRQHDHDEALVEEWESESFPASDPPAH